jgi:hypothetical protein
MLRSVEIQKGSTTFFVIKTFDKYLCYETCMGNVVKINGQSASGQINKISSLIPFLKRRDGTQKFKLFYYEFDLLSGLVEHPLPLSLRGRKNTMFSYQETTPTLIQLNYKPMYDLIVRECCDMYFCFEFNGNYLLYDDDLGNPLKADIYDDKGNSFIVQSMTKQNTLTIINSLPDSSIVYSLKIDKRGIVEGNKELHKFDYSKSKKTFENTKLEKVTDKTRSLFKKRETREKKIESLSR